MESLLVLDPAVCEVRRQDVQRHELRVVQEASPRVLLISGAADGLKALAALPGVTIVTSPVGSIAEKLAAFGLSTAERLFVRSWLRRKEGPTRQRAGAGLPWDAPGFDAP